MRIQTGLAKKTALALVALALTALAVLAACGGGGDAENAGTVASDIPTVPEDAGTVVDGVSQERFDEFVQEQEGYVETLRARVRDLELANEEAPAQDGEVNLTAMAEQTNEAVEFLSGRIDEAESNLAVVANTLLNSERIGTSPDMAAINADMDRIDGELEDIQDSLESLEDEVRSATRAASGAATEAAEAKRLASQTTAGGEGSSGSTAIAERLDSIEESIALLRTRVFTLESAPDAPATAPQTPDEDDVDESDFSAFGSLRLKPEITAARASLTSQNFQRLQNFLVCEGQGGEQEGGLDATTFRDAYAASVAETQEAQEAFFGPLPDDCSASYLDIYRGDDVEGPGFEGIGAFDIFVYASFDPPICANDVDEASITLTTDQGALPLIRRSGSQSAIPDCDDSAALQVIFSAEDKTFPLTAQSLTLENVFGLNGEAASSGGFTETELDYGEDEESDETP